MIMRWLIDYYVIMKHMVFTRFVFCLMHGRINTISYTKKCWRSLFNMAAENCTSFTLGDVFRNSLIIVQISASSAKNTLISVEGHVDERFLSRQRSVRKSPENKRSVRAALYPVFLLISSVDR